MAQVHLHELYLAMCWYLDSPDPARRVHPAAQKLNRLRGILKRAPTSAGRGREREDEDWFFRGRAGAPVVVEVL